jgi:hypothetical protein
LKKTKLFSGKFSKATVSESTAAGNPDRQQPRRLPAASTVRMSGRKSRTLELLAFDEKSTFDCFCFIWAYKAGLALYAQMKQNNQKWIFHRKLKIPTSDRWL